MSKQGTRSRTKQGRVNSGPSNGSKARVKSGSSNGGSAAKTTAAPLDTATAQKPAVTQPKPGATTVKAPSSGAAKPAQAEGRVSARSIKQQRKQQKIQNRLAQQKEHARSRRMTIALVAAALVVAGGILTYILVSNATGTSGHTVFNPDYPPINGVYCDQLEQTAYHHHVLLTIYIDGQQVTVPQGVGIAGTPSSPTCYYWLHTHDTSGVVHVEAPSGGSYTLKDFLDIWQSFANANNSIFYPSQLSSSTGWTIYVYQNGVGKKLTGGLNSVDISSNQAWHELITIMYNSPQAKPVTTYSWQPGL